MCRSAVPNVSPTDCFIRALTPTATVQEHTAAQGLYLSDLRTVCDSLELQLRHERACSSRRAPAAVAPAPDCTPPQQVGSCTPAMQRH